jgi:hypothetical protein
MYDVCFVLTILDKENTPTKYYCNDYHIFWYDVVRHRPRYSITLTLGSFPVITVVITSLRFYGFFWHQSCVHM